MISDPVFYASRNHQREVVVFVVYLLLDCTGLFTSFFVIQCAKIYYKFIVIDQYQYRCQSTMSSLN